MMHLKEVAAAVNGQAPEANPLIQGVATDSRKVKPGDLFVALTGPRFDGNEFAAQAAQQGAVAMLAGRSVASSPIPVIVVADTRLSLGALARHWRGKLDVTVVAVTGSNGKTTVKEMLARILSQRGDVLATEGNLNNDIGVPLTLLRLRKEHRFAVIEMGASRPGEIRYLSALAQPRAAIVTNAAPAHLAGFGSVADVVKAKSEIFTALGGDGLAVINHDDRHAAQFRQFAAPHRIVSFGLKSGADVTADAEGIATKISQQGFVTEFCVRSGDVQIDVRLPLAGFHNVLNALAVVAVGLDFGLSAQEIAAGLNSMAPVPGRLVPRRGIGGVRLIDDSYNANPASVKAAIDVLMTCDAPRVLALGDMLELGADAAALHADVGVYARERGVDALYATGVYSKETVESFGPGAWYFADSAALGEAMRGDITSGRLTASTILIKGSRGIAMEKVAAALQNGGGAAPASPHKALI